MVCMHYTFGLLPAAVGMNVYSITNMLILFIQTIYLSNGDSQDEQRRGTVGIAVKVPLAVNLAGKCLIGNVSDQPLREPQADLISETAAFELPAPLQNGPPETVGTLVTHLDKGGRKRGK